MHAIHTQRGIETHTHTYKHARMKIGTVCTYRHEHMLAHITLMEIEYNILLYVAIVTPER